MKLYYVWPLLLALTLSGCTAEENLIKETVHLESGSILGQQDLESGVISFKGIPFAAPPVGDLRWKAPQPVEPWEGTMECTKFGPSPAPCRLHQRPLCSGLRNS
jgi:para-nitrobenzyl esterase